jgi:hypothetical protein
MFPSNWRTVVAAGVDRVRSDWNLYAASGIIIAIVGLCIWDHRIQCDNSPRNCESASYAASAGETTANANTSATVTSDSADENLEYERRSAIAAEHQATLAAWTLALGVIGTIFVIITLRYNRDATSATILAARASQEAAVAAAKSTSIAEKALMNLEVAYLYPQDIQFITDDAGSRISVAYKNFGRCAAILEKVEFHISVAPRNVYGTPPLYAVAKGFMADDMVGDGQTSDPFPYWDASLARYSGTIYSGTNSLYIVISTEWKDVLERRRHISQSFIWHPVRRKFVPGVQIWDEAPFNRGSRDQG